MRQAHKCSFCGSDNKVSFSSRYGDYLCRLHYMQVYHTGTIKKNPRNGSNVIVISDDCAEIILVDRNGAEKARALIDIEDVDRCKEYKWSLSSNGYVVTRRKDETILLHRFIINPADDNVVDHKNHNRLDNRKSNLREATFSQNGMNKIMLNRNTSGVTGVSWSKRDKCYETYISIDGKRIHLGDFKEFETAVSIRKAAEEALFKDFRYKQEAG